MMPCPAPSVQGHTWKNRIVTLSNFYTSTSGSAYGSCCLAYNIRVLFCLHVYITPYANSFPERESGIHLAKKLTSLCGFEHSFKKLAHGVYKRLSPLSVPLSSCICLFRAMWCFLTTYTLAHQYIAVSGTRAGYTMCVDPLAPSLV
jgi:hypothetical protein